MKLSDEFRTPPELFKELDKVFNFFWDICCTKENCLVKGQGVEAGYDYLKEDTSQYEGTAFMNSPYSKPLPFIKKAWEDSKHIRIVMLLKADMSTKWFNYGLECEDAGSMTIHRPVDVNEISLPPLWEYSDITIFPLRKRISFVDPATGLPCKSGAKFSNLIMIFDRRT